MSNKRPPHVSVDPADITALMSWLRELEDADSYAGFTLMGWVARAPQAAIDNLNAAREVAPDAPSE